MRGGLISCFWLLCICHTFLTFLYFYIENKELCLPPSYYTINPGQYPFNFSVSAQDVCRRSSDDEVFFIVVVCSAVKNSLERQAIRDSWGSSLHSGTNSSSRLVFMLGTSLLEEDNTAVAKESELHRDIVQANFIDSYRNLTYKTVALLKWVSENCNNSKYVLKADDDMFINMRNLVAAANIVKDKGDVLFGCLYRNSIPLRDRTSKWCVSQEEYSATRYPDFLSGTAYAMTTGSTHKLYAASKNQRYVFLEDVFVAGICADEAGIPRIGFEGFLHTSLETSELACAITIHHTNARRLRALWRILNKTKRVCETGLISLP